jgi:hypothetical protein
MSGKDLDALAKGLAEERISRGKALKRLGAALLGGSLLAAFPGVASAAPQRCITCVCGTGRPCNPKGDPVCTEDRGFPVGTTCEQACARKNLRFCGGATKFHCPRGCPS